MDKKEQRKQYNLNNRDKIIEYSKQWNSEHPEQRKQYRDTHKETHKEYLKKYNLEHEEEIKAKKKQYDLEHKEERKAHAREYIKNKRQTDPGFKIKMNLSSYIRNNLRMCIQTKKDRTVDYLSMSISEYVIYLENQFDSKMNWDNYGTYWQIDHIIPISKFDLTDHEQVKQCFHYSNTRPLYWKENREKWNKICS